jgi:hypothetical protein
MRARGDLGHAFHSTQFVVAAVILDALAAAGAVWATFHRGVAAQATSAALATVFGTAFLAAVVFLWLWITAPVRQRDEARARVWALMPAAFGERIEHDEAVSRVEKRIGEGAPLLEELERCGGPGEVAHMLPRLLGWELETFADMEAFHKTWATRFGLDAFQERSPNDKPALVMVMKAKMHRLHGLIDRPYGDESKWEGHSAR